LAGTQLVATTTDGYDGAGRLTSMLESHNSTTINNYAWSYDAANRITNQTDIDGTTTYTYDATNQLVGATQSFQPNESYAYDSNGNRTNSGDSTGTDNRLLSDGTYTYQYDNEGNLTSQTTIATGQVTTYQWDNRNRLVRATTKSSSGTILSDTQYTYDPFDRRISKSVSTNGGTPVVERYVYDGQNILLSLNGSGTVTHRYLYGPGTDQVLADQNAAGTVLWTLTDQLGTVRDIINSSGVVLNHIKYDTFGNIISQTNPAITTRFGYTGQILDSETGFYYYQSRYYDPATGRFISIDPDGFSAGDANLFRYVGNSPVTQNDPSGRYAIAVGAAPTFAEFVAATLGEDAAATIAAAAGPVGWLFLGGLTAYELYQAYNAYQQYQQAHQQDQSNQNQQPGAAAPAAPATQAPANPGTGDDKVPGGPDDEGDEPNSDEPGQGNNQGTSGSNGNETPIDQGAGRAPSTGEPNSIYEQLNSDGSVKSRTFYNEDGQPFARQDFDHEHFDKDTQQYLQPHEHNYDYNESGQPNGSSVRPVPPGYNNSPSN
jgi:RHS repeat-associated protein